MKEIGDFFKEDSNSPWYRTERKSALEGQTNADKDNKNGKPSTGTAVFKALYQVMRFLYFFLKFCFVCFVLLFESQSSIILT